MLLLVNLIVLLCELFIVYSFVFFRVKQVRSACTCSAKYAE